MGVTARARNLNKLQRMFKDAMLHAGSSTTSQICRAYQMTSRPDQYLHTHQPGRDYRNTGHPVTFIWLENSDICKNRSHMRVADR